MSIEPIIERILYRFSVRQKHRPFLVGIDGLGGSGKTTLIKNVKQELMNHDCNVVTFNLDDYIVEKNKRYDTGYEEWYEYYYLQWDVRRLRKNMFEALHKNCSILQLPFYDKRKDCISTKQYTIVSDQIVLLEGIFLQRREWKDFYDFVIFLDCPRDLRLQRVMNRDSYIGDYQAILNKYQTRYFPGEEHYF